MAVRRTHPARPAGGIVLSLGLFAVTVVASVGSTGATVDNPPVGRTCGADLVLLLDASSSIQGRDGSVDSNGAADEVVAAATAFLESVEGTGARVAIVTYDASSRVQAGFTSVTARSIALGGVHAKALGDPGGPNGPVPASATGYSAHVRDGIGTNWEVGLAEVARLIGTADADGAVSVVHITDGVPTWHVRPDGTSTGTGTAAEHVSHAATEADRIKSMGAHVYTVGVGPAATHVAALTAISGPDVYDQSDAGDTLDPVADDVLLISDPSRLESALVQFARSACGSAVTVRVLTSESADGPFTPAVGWVVSTSPGSVRGYDWIAPDVGPDGTKAVLSNSSGEARFAWSVAEPDSWVPRVEIAASTRRGFATFDRTCEVQGAKAARVSWVDPLVVDLDVAEEVICELRAVTDFSNEGELAVELSAIAGSEDSCPGSDDLVVTADFAVTYSAALTNTTGQVAQDVSIIVDGLDWSPHFAEEIAAGETLEAVVTVPTTEDVLAVLSASATIGKETAKTSDSTAVSVAYPALSLQKSADRSLVPVGTSVTYELLLRNLGDVALADVVVDDPDCGGLSGPGKTNDDGDEYLDRDEVWTYTCSATIAADLTNVALASAQGVDGKGRPIPGGGVEARSNASVSVVSTVAGATQSDGSPAMLSITGREVVGTLIGGFGLLGLGLIALAARRRRG